MTIGTGIAIVGVWLGVGIIGLKDTKGWSGVVAFFAMMATMFICTVK